VKKIRNPQQRLRKMMDLCKKNICEGSTQVKGMGDDFPEEDGEPREHSGGCGSLQPSLKVEGMKVVAEFKPPSKKDQDEVQLPEAVERKQVWFGDKVGDLAEPALLVPNQTRAVQNLAPTEKATPGEKREINRGKDMRLSFQFLPEVVI
jgi:hypothetical protein